MLGLINTAGAVGQCWAVATLLAGGPAQPWLAVFAALALLRAAVQVAAERASFEAGAAARERLRVDALGRILAAGPALLRQIHSATLANAAVDQVDALEPWFARWLPASALAVAAPGLVAIAAIAADPFSGVLLLLLGLLVPVGMAVAGIGAAAASRRQFEAMARLQARFLDRVRGMATIVSLGRVEDEAGRLKVAADELRHRTMRVLRVAFLSSAFLDCAAAAAIVVIAIRVATHAPAGIPAAGLFVLLLIPEFFAPLRAYSAAYQDAVHARQAAAALAALPVAPVQRAPMRTIAANGVTVAFEHVTATWDPQRGPALRDVSFRVPAGETLVLAGPSGAGKSTVLELLLGFLAPDAGRVTLNGVDVSSVTPEALSRLTAWVGQRPLLFAASLRENIRFGRPEATDAETEDAARRAHVLDFAAALPQGLDTVVGEGGFGLSGGQAQRVAIARAFLRNAPLLLLDEPTAHLDPATEREVLDSLRRLTAGRTTILASHSVAAHAFAGRRLDLRDGQVIAAARGAA
jgi:ATP-binding cassette subfamily C protein CydD